MVEPTPRQLFWMIIGAIVFTIFIVALTDAYHMRVYHHRLHF